ncbi:hypothetical protein VTO73DRAFT_7585 [Trametes versicolor]
MNHDNGFKEGLVPGPGDHAGTWHTNLPAGTTVFFSVTDGAGVFGRSADFVVQPSADSSCLKVLGESYWVCIIVLWSLNRMFCPPLLPEWRK